MNSYVKVAVKQVPWSDVMTLHIPTNEKGCKKHPHTALAVTDRSGKAKGKRVHESITHKQNLMSV